MMQSPDPQATHKAGNGGGSTVQSIEFGHANIYFIKTTSGHILVDVGMPNKEKELDEAFDKAGIDPKSVQLIIATHGHLDHVGTIAHAKRLTNGIIICHRSYSDDMSKGRAERATARNLKGHFLNLLTAMTGNKFEGIKPDIVMDDEFDLNEYGISGKIIHTPGHSPSSVSIVLDSGEALIGDLVREDGPDRIGPGMFYEDKQVLRHSLEKLTAFGPKKIYLSHGTYIDNKTLSNAIATL